MRKKVLITGVAGMLGSHLANQLLEIGYEVLGIDDFSVGTPENIENISEHTNLEMHVANLDKINWDDQKFKGYDYFVHMAAHKKITENQAVIPLLDTNVEQSMKIINFCTSNSVKLIFASTSDVYGYGTKIPFSESDDIMLGASTGKRWAYAVSKLYMEHVILGYVKERGLDACIIRYFGGFSEKASFSWSGGHIPIFIDAILNDKEVMIHGDGKQTRSIGHAEDLSSGTVLALEHFDITSGEIINIGNDEELSVIDSLKIIANLLNKNIEESKINYVEEQHIFGTYRDIRRRRPDLTKARELLNYEPQINFVESVSRVLAQLNVKLDLEK